MVNIITDCLVNFHNIIRTTIILCFNYINYGYVGIQFEYRSLKCIIDNIQFRHRVTVTRIFFK